MKALTINTGTIVCNAIKNMNYDMDALTATSKAAQMEILQKRMMRGEVVKFAYRKKDNSIRIAVGSLQSDAVQANIAGTGMPKKHCGMFVYLDLQKMAWRGFLIQNFIGIID